ncbi:hypothetical protein YWIDRAFT_03683 [Streptomyces sp. SceaMP-e96]|nr:hypothetical protein YWIDRAFT_03683 [Streptomyces sp. SceaMP-e96]
MPPVSLPPLPGISDVRAVNRARWGALAALVRRAAQEL